MTPLLRTADGTATAMDVGRWRRPTDDVERLLLHDLPTPVLDVGCGPGRVVEELAASGRPALGIDPVPSAVQETRRRGASALRRSVFDPLPGEGRWGAAVLLDGNIGIGGDPDALLQRLHEVLRPDGLVLTELEGPGQPSVRIAARVETDVHRSDWFPWARVGVDDVDDLADRTGFAVRDRIVGRARCFAWLAST